MGGSLRSGTAHIELQTTGSMNLRDHLGSYSKFIVASNLAKLKLAEREFLIYWLQTSRFKVTAL